MAIRKRKYSTGSVTWGFYFDVPGSTRQERKRIYGSGYASKAEAIAAEAKKRIEVGEEAEARKRGATAGVPHTIGQLLDQFFSQHCDVELEPKTAHRYHEMATYLSDFVMKMRIADVTTVHMTNEWKRLKDEGGHHRRTREARPLSAKTVRNIAGMVSAAFGWGIENGKLTFNPVTKSRKPKGSGVPRGVAFSPAQQRVFIDASMHRIVPAILEFSAAAGTRRGETLALAWSSIKGNVASIERSLSQVKSQVFIKGTKTTAGVRKVTLPNSALMILERRKAEQAVYRQQFGEDYRTDLDLVFCEPNGDPLKPDSISSTVSLLRAKLGLPKGASLHALRHSHGSQLLAEGVDLATVSERLGHSNPATTMRIYAHSLKGKDAQAAEVWERMQTKADSTGKAKQ